MRHHNDLFYYVIATIVLQIVLYLQYYLIRVRTKEKIILLILYILNKMIYHLFIIFLSKITLTLLIQKNIF